MGRLLVYTNPSSPEREDEFNRWYDEVHIPEICAIDPFVAAQRFKCTPDQPMGDPGYQYVAMYEFTGPPEEAVNALMGGDVDFDMSDALDTATAKLVVLEEVAARYER